MATTKTGRQGRSGARCSRDCRRGRLRYSGGEHEREVFSQLGRMMAASAMVAQASRLHSLPCLWMKMQSRRGDCGTPRQGGSPLRRDLRRGGRLRYSGGMGEHGQDPDATSHGAAECLIIKRKNSISVPFGTACTTVAWGFRTENESISCHASDDKSVEASTLATNPTLIFSV